MRRAGRRLLGYWLVSTALFAAGFALGAAASASPDGTPFFPVREHGLTPVAAGSLFVHNTTIAVVTAAGAVLFGLPVVGLLFYNGFVVGSVTAAAVATRGAVETAALVLPHGVVELPAVWLAGAVGLRWTHALWRAARGERGGSGLGSLLGETLGWFGLAVLLLAVAAVLEATVTPRVAQLVT